MKFDSNTAWQEASAAIAANRDVLFALAGVFFLLPSLAVALLFPAPEPTAGMNEEAMMALMSDYYLSAAPAMIPMAVLQLIGTLAMLTILTDKARPTVGEAIRIGAISTPSYFAAQFLFAIGIGLVGGLLLAIVAATGVAALVAVAVGMVFVLVIYAGVKTSLVAPLIAVEGILNPVAALKRSWALTKGNSVRLAMFFALVMIAFLVVMLIVVGLAGALVAVLAGAETGEIVGTVLSSAIGAVMTVYFVAIVAAAHRQLAGPSREAVSKPFD